MDCKVWFYERCGNETVVNTGLCTLCVEGYALLATLIKFGRVCFFSLFLSKHFLVNSFSNDLLKFGK
jgi:hypothetical protein